MLKAAHIEELLSHAQRLMARGHYVYAEPLLRRLVAHRVPAAFALLGDLLRVGSGADEVSLYQLYSEGDRLGDPSATAALARCAGRGIGCDRDETRAFAIARKAADLGSVHGRAATAQCLLNGFGCERDPLAALPYLEALVDEEIPGLLYSLGYILMIDEDGYPRDPERAATLFVRAAHAGSDEACHALASIAHHAGNESEAARWIAFLHDRIPDSEIDAYFADQPDDEIRRLYYAVREAELERRED